MQIIFDTRRDTRADAVQLQAMLTAFLAYAPDQRTDGAIPRSEFTGEQLRGAYEAPMLGVTSLDDSAQRRIPIPTEQPLAFTPGTVSGSVPSDAGAAQVPIAPEASTVGVPPPPIVASVPAPPAVAPVVPAAPSSPAATGDVDSAGLPWDKRIHSSSKAKNADGSWRKLRGLNDAALVSRVEAELRAVAANGSISVVPAGAGATAVVITPPSGAAVPTPPQVPPPPGTDAPAAPPGTVVAPDVATPEGLMEWVTPRMMDGSLTFDTVAAALQANGVESLAALKTNPAAVPGVYAALGGT